MGVVSRSRVCLVGVVVRWYIDFLILLIPTPLVSALFCSSIPTFCSFLTLGAHAQRGLRYLVCVCVSVRSILATTSKSKPRKRYQRFITLLAFGGLVGLFSSS